MIPKPFTRKEWIELCKATLHGSLPVKTQQRLFATIDSLFLKFDEYLERGREIIKLRTCIEEGHDYGDEPTCKRCGHYGPEDYQHLLELENQKLKKKIQQLGVGYRRMKGKK